MMETALVFDRFGRTIHWHEPLGRSGGALPDSRDLWDVLWEHRAEEKGGTGRLAGVAHTHPWNGPTGASGTDLTTFHAVELGLGQRLVWPIVTFTHVAWYARRRSITYADLAGLDPMHDVYVPHNEMPGWRLADIEELRSRSR